MPLFSSGILNALHLSKKYFFPIATHIIFSTRIKRDKMGKYHREISLQSLQTNSAVDKFIHDSQQLLREEMTKNKE